MMLEFLSDNADVWAGIAYWSAGPAWGDYPFSIEPVGEFGSADLTDRPQMEVFQRHLPAYGFEQTGSCPNSDLTATALMSCVSTACWYSVN